MLRILYPKFTNPKNLQKLKVFQVATWLDTYGQISESKMATRCMIIPLQFYKENEMLTICGFHYI